MAKEDEKKKPWWRNLAAFLIVYVVGLLIMKAYGLPRWAIFAVALGIPLTILYLKYVKGGSAYGDPNTITRKRNGKTVGIIVGRAGKPRAVPDKTPIPLWMWVFILVVVVGVGIMFLGGLASAP